MMSIKLVLLAAVLATCCAKPFYFSAVPELEILRAPSIAYGFGSGFASDIAGVKHSYSLGTSFQTGDGQAIGAGMGSTDGGVSANGVGYAHTNPAALAYRAYPYAATPYYTYPYNVGYNNGYNNFRSPVRDSYGNIATAQNVGSRGYSNALSQNGPSGSTATASNFNHYPSRNLVGNVGSAAFSSAVRTPYGSIAKSITQIHNGQDTSSNVAASVQNGDTTANTAQSYLQSGNEVQNSGATTIDGPGIQALHSHATNNGAAGTFY